METKFPNVEACYHSLPLRLGVCSQTRISTQVKWRIMRNIWAMEIDLPLCGRQRVVLSPARVLAVWQNCANHLIRGDLGIAALPGPVVRLLARALQTRPRRAMRVPAPN